MALLRRRSRAEEDQAATGQAPASRLKKWRRPTPPRLDPVQGDPALAQLRTAAEAADWPAVRERLTAVPDGWDRTWLLLHTVKIAGIEQWIPEVVAAGPDPALAALVSGARHVEWAWEARTGAQAKYVSKEQFKIFFGRLGTAQDLLYEAAEREPDWVAPWYFLQIAGRGLQVGPDIARLRFEATVRRCPGHLGAHRQQLQQLCRKWSGSHEQMHAFARASMLSAPEGSPLGELVAIAHLEEWLDLDSGPDAEYIRRPRVAEELHEAAYRSIRHPGYGRPRGWAETFNTFAMAFSLAGERKAAAELFAALDGLVTPFPWGYLNGGDPVAAYRSASAAAGR